MRGAAAPAGAARETTAEGGGKKKEGRRDRNGICQESPAPSASINRWPGRVCKATSTYRMFLLSTTMFSQPANQRDVNGKKTFKCYYKVIFLLFRPCHYSGAPAGAPYWWKPLENQRNAAFTPAGDYPCKSAAYKRDSASFPCVCCVCARLLIARLLLAWLRDAAALLLRKPNWITAAASCWFFPVKPRGR